MVVVIVVVAFAVVVVAFAVVVVIAIMVLYNRVFRNSDRITTTRDNDGILSGLTRLLY